MAKKRVAILISGRGSNMVALIEAAKHREYPAEIALVVSNLPEAAGLARAEARASRPPWSIIARTARIARHSSARCRPCSMSTGRARLPRRLHAAADRLHSCAMAGRLLNIHPALLPRFKGLDTHGRALASRREEHGATVHFVVPEMDAGPIIAQAAVPVREDDNAETLAARVLAVEHRIYPQALARSRKGA